jgi:hypothetical protein
MQRALMTCCAAALFLLSRAWLGFVRLGQFKGMTGMNFCDGAVMMVPGEPCGVLYISGMIGSSSSSCELLAVPTHLPTKELRLGDVR